MISPKGLAHLSSIIYEKEENYPWLHYWTKDDVIVGHTKIDDTDILVIRGSATAEDWIEDARFIPVWHHDLGFVHHGFISGMDDVLEETKSVLGDKVCITGHSLGGARARILAALRIINHLPINQVTVFGSPKPGFSECASIVQLVPIHTSYRNRNDPVPELPGPFLYKHSEDYQLLDEKPTGEELGGLEDHRVALYVEGAPY